MHFLGYGYEEFGYRLCDPVTRKFIRSRDIVFLEDQIIGDIEKSGEPWSFLEIIIIPTSVSPLGVHDDYEGAGEDNDDGPIEPVEQAPLELLAPPVKPKLRISIRE